MGWTYLSGSLGTGLGTGGELDAALSAAGQPAAKRRRLAESGEREAGGNPEPWPAYPALRMWRESGREVHQYAYAGVCCANLLNLKKPA